MESHKKAFTHRSLRASHRVDSTHLSLGRSTSQQAYEHHERHNTTTTTTTTTTTQRFIGIILATLKLGRKIPTLVSEESAVSGASSLGQYAQRKLSF
jgi:hypothetical protein